MEDLVPLTLFLVTGVVLCLYLYLRYRANRDVQSTVQAALERGQELTPELLEALRSPSAAGPRDLRRGVLWLSLAAAMAIMAGALGEPDLLGPAAFPLMLGLAYLTLWRFTASKAP